VNIASSLSRFTRHGLDNCHLIGYRIKIPLTKGAFREGTFGRRKRDAVPARGLMRSAPGRLWGTGRPAKGPVRTERA
jgi:hypothetical protein